MNHARKHAVRRAAAGAGCALALAATAACTGTSPTPAATPSKPPHTGATATVEAAPVTLGVRVTRVAGRLSPGARRQLEANVGRTVSRYLHEAFLGGSYPRSDFSDAFATFTAGARRQAMRQQDLLTNKALGPGTASVTARRSDAYLSVLAPYHVAAGVTARLRLVFVAEPTSGTAKRVTVRGRLMLTRAGSGGWAIFGYDLSRSVATAGEGS